MLMHSEFIGKAIDVVKNRLYDLDAEKLEHLEKTAQLDNTWEGVQYQELQAQAHASGKLKTEDATWLYNVLGRENPSPENFARHTLAERIVALEVFAILAKERLSVK